MLWVFITLSSAIFFAIKDILAKKLFKKNVKPLQLVFEQYFLLLLICLTLLYPSINFDSFKYMWQLYILKSLAIGSSTLFYFEMLKKFEISHVSPILNLSPLVLLVFSIFFLGEVITFLQLSGIFLILISTYLLEVTIHHHHKDNPHKYHFQILKKMKSSFLLLAVATLITISFAAIFDKMILNQVDVYTNLFFTAIIILIVLICYYLKEGYLMSALRGIKDESETLVIAIFSIISNFLVLLAIAIPSAMVSLIIPLRRTSTLMASIFGGILFHEKHLKQKFITTIGMLLGVILIVI